MTLSRTSFEQYVINAYSRSVYEISLEVAIGWYVNQPVTAFMDSDETSKVAWDLADSFINQMRKRHETIS